eukprot:445179_1
MAAFPPNVSSIAFKYKLYFKETGINFEYFTQFHGKCMSRGWPKYKLRHVELQYFDSYTVGAFISLIDVYDVEGNVITKNYINKNIINCIERPISFKSEEYIWRIDDINMINSWKKANVMDEFKSNIFVLHGFKWFMECMPNGNDKESIGSFRWYLNLICLSNKIKRVICHYNISLQETKTTKTYTTWFDHGAQSHGWENGDLKTNDIKHLKSFTFKVNIKLLDVFDINNNNNNNYSLFQSPVIYDIPTVEFEWNITNN